MNDLVRQHTALGDSDLERVCDEIRGFLTNSHGGYGPMSHLRPAVRLSATPARWKRPVVKLGTHPAEWPADAGRIAAQ